LQPRGACFAGALAVQAANLLGNHFSASQSNTALAAACHCDFNGGRSFASSERPNKSQSGEYRMERREFFRRGGATLSVAALAAGATARAATSTAVAAASPVLLSPLPPVKASMDRIIKITVCTRPFRAAGPRFDVEQIGHKTVVHNYGHGGSGWSLSWGSAAVVAEKAMMTGVREIAVIGCGALGLTAAITLQRAGAKVSIYAKDRPPEVRSMWATGVWSPDSRICLAAKATPEFKALWARMARTSFRAWSNFLGLPGAPVEWYDNYELNDEPYSQYAAQEEAADTIGFAEQLQQETTPEIGPIPEDLPAGSHSFPVPYVRRSTNMVFNLITYQRLLFSDFLAGGGTIEQREFHTPHEFTTLPQKTIVNCPGYGARALFGDESIVPVRGQLTRLIPQPEVTYGLGYKNVFMVPRRDGIVLQHQGIGAAQGYNDSNTDPDWDEAQRSVSTIAELSAVRASPA
jgi:glycine/D-amino acid oxidase-like deaminating enzyme